MCGCQQLLLSLTTFSKERHWQILHGIMSRSLLCWSHSIEPIWKRARFLLALLAILLSDKRNLFPQEQQGQEPLGAYGLYRECSSQKKKRILAISDTLPRGPRCRPDAESVWGHSRHDCYAVTFIHVGTRNIDWSHWDDEEWLQGSGNIGVGGWDSRVVLTIFPVEKKSFCRWQTNAGAGYPLPTLCCVPPQKGPQLKPWMRSGEATSEFCICGDCL